MPLYHNALETVETQHKSGSPAHESASEYPVDSGAAHWGEYGYSETTSLQLTVETPSESHG